MTRPARFVCLALVSVLAACPAVLFVSCGARPAPVPGTSEGTDSATDAGANAEASIADAGAEPDVEPPAPPIVERPRPSASADPLVIAEYHFEPEIWEAVHRPPDRVPDEVLAALGKELPRAEVAQCKSSGRSDCRLRITIPPYGVLGMPWDALREKRVEEISGDDFELSSWRFPISFSPRGTPSRTLNVWQREGSWTSSSANIEASMKNVAVLETKQNLGSQRVRRRAIGTYGLDTNYLIVIPENKTLEDGRFFYVDPMREAYDKAMKNPRERPRYLKMTYTPVDEPMGFREFVAQLKDEVRKHDEKNAETLARARKANSLPPAPPADADPLAVARTYFRPEIWAAVHRPPDRVPDEVLAALGKNLPWQEYNNCLSSRETNRRLRIVGRPYGFYRMPTDALRTRDAEEISSEDFEVYHWGFPFSCSSREDGWRMIGVDLRNGKWESWSSINVDLRTGRFLAFEKKHGLGGKRIHRRGIGIPGGDLLGYLIVIPDGKTLEDGRFHFVDPASGNGIEPENYARECCLPADEPIGFREFVVHLKDEVRKSDEHEATLRSRIDALYNRTGE